MTYPLIGNYGRLRTTTSPSDRGCAALVVANATAAVLDDGRQLAALLRDDGIPAIAGVDTRALARHLRPTARARAGSARPARRTRTAAVAAARALPRWEDQDFVAQVSPEAPREVGDAAAGGPLVAIVDLRAQGEHRPLAPPAGGAGADPAAHRLAGRRARLGRGRARAVTRSRGPRPAGPVALARAVIDDGRPLLGICLGHQIVGRAAGADTRRLRFGHHGANHPVRDLDTGWSR